MPRTPLGLISGNRLRHQELTPAKRGRILGRLAEGATPTSVAKAENVPRSTVKATERATVLRENDESRPRSGRPACITQREERAIRRAIEKEPGISYNRLKYELGLSHHQSTIYRHIKTTGIKKWIAKKRPLLTPEVAFKRLTWC